MKIFVLCVVAGTLLWMAAIVPASQILVTPTPIARVVTAQVPIPQDITYNCNPVQAPAYVPICGLITDLVAKNDPSIDIILIRYNITLVDASGTKIFPRP